MGSYWEHVYPNTSKECGKKIGTGKAWVSIFPTKIQRKKLEFDIFKVYYGTLKEFHHISTNVIVFASLKNCISL